MKQARMLGENQDESLRETSNALLLLVKTQRSILIKTHNEMFVLGDFRNKRMCIDTHQMQIIRGA
jgi:hypothetical protein